MALNFGVHPTNPIFTLGVTEMKDPHAERRNAKARSIEQALTRIGEPITEAQAQRLATIEYCECKEGMFAPPTGGSCSPAGVSSPWWA